jgi:hypothetical protein
LAEVLLAAGGVAQADGGGRQAKQRALAVVGLRRKGVLGDQAVDERAHARVVLEGGEALDDLLDLERRGLALLVARVADQFQRRRRQEVGGAGGDGRGGGGHRWFGCAGGSRGVRGARGLGRFVSASPRPRARALGARSRQRVPGPVIGCRGERRVARAVYRASRLFRGVDACVDRDCWV